MQYKNMLVNMMNSRKNLGISETELFQKLDQILMNVKKTTRSIINRGIINKLCKRNAQKTKLNRPERKLEIYCLKRRKDMLSLFKRFINLFKVNIKQRS